MSDSIKASTEMQINPPKANEKNNNKSSIIFNDSNEEENFQNTNRVTPETFFSPKDKVSNVVWNNEIDIGDDIGVITIFKSENFGCIVKLNYEKIMNDCVSDFV